MTVLRKQAAQETSLLAKAKELGWKNIRIEDKIEHLRFLNRDRNNVFKIMKNGNPSSGINVIRLENGELSADPAKMADRMSRFLTDTFTKPEEDIDNLDIDWDSEDIEDGLEIIRDIELTEDEIISIIKKVKPSNGVDFLGISINMLKMSIGITSEFFTNFCNKSYRDSNLLSELKRTFIRYIPKGMKSTYELANIRPINISPVMVKIAERGIKHVVSEKLELSNFFHDHQYGFRKNRSTQHSLM